MDTSFDILVIILSVFLAIFLVLAIIIAVLVLKLVKHIKLVTEKAEHIIENVEHVGDTFRNAAGPLALFRIVSNIVNIVSKHNKRK